MKDTGNPKVQRERVETTEYTYTVVFEPAEEGGYIVSVPALPGCATQGETLEEAREMVKDAIRGFLVSLEADGEEISVEPARGLTTERVAVSLKA